MNLQILLLNIPASLLVHFLLPKTEKKINSCIFFSEQQLNVFVIESSAQILIFYLFNFTKYLNNNHRILNVCFNYQNKYIILNSKSIHVSDHEQSLNKPDFWSFLPRLSYYMYLIAYESLKKKSIITNLLKILITKTLCL